MYTVSNRKDNKKTGTALFFLPVFLGNDIAIAGRSKKTYKIFQKVVTKILVGAYTLFLNQDSPLG